MRFSHLVATAAVLLLVSAALIWSPADAASRRSLSYLLPQDTLERFAFEATHHLTTEFVRLPPEADAYDVTSLQADIADVHTTIHGSMERFVGRVFRDRSLGLISRLVDLEGTVDRGQGVGPLDLSGLGGKSVSLRVHASGELLDSFGWSHLLGAGRNGALVVEAMLMQVLRLPSKIPQGDERIGSNYSLRFRTDPSVERDWNHVMAFVAAEPPADCKRCVAMSYSGDLKEASRDKHPSRPMTLDGQGQLSGTLVLGAPAGGGRRPLVSNTWSLRWDRTIRSERIGGATRGEVAQTAEITGRFYREEGS